MTAPDAAGTDAGTAAREAGGAGPGLVAAREAGGAGPGLVAARNGGGTEAGFVAAQHELAIAGDEIGLAWLGQAGFAIRTAGGGRLWVDPYLSNVCVRFSGNERLRPPPVPAARARFDAVLVTHEHKDHCDIDSMPALAAGNPAAVFAGPPSCVDLMAAHGVPERQLVAVHRDDELALAGVPVRVCLAHHTPDAVGYLIGAGPRVYVSGDTSYGPDLADVGPHRPDLALVCANGKLGNLSPAEAARLTVRLGAGFGVPMHYGMFAANTVDPQEYVAALAALAAGPRGVVLDFGRWHRFRAGAAPVPVGPPHRPDGTGPAGP